MIVFSVEQITQSERTNQINTDFARNCLKAGGMGFRECIGVYKDVSGVGFITRDVELGRSLASNFNQECYLERGHYGVWYLIEASTGKVLDHFKGIAMISKEAALKSSSYTEMNGNYYMEVK